MSRKPSLTERQWRASKDPERLLAFLGTWCGPRKRRLFACACCRRIWNWVEGTPAATAVEVAERFADGLLGEPELATALSGAAAAATRGYKEYWSSDSTPSYVSHLAATACGCACAPPKATRASRGYRVADCARYARQVPGFAAEGAVEHGRRWRQHTLRESAAQAAILREIVGNPFRPVALDPSWLTSTVVALATGIDEERALDRMPILADALQDAGCDSDDLLTHLRDPHATHVRGCWALDLVLGKE